MSLFYGLAAGLFVSASTWAAMTYISQVVGVCLGFFLLTFFAVSAIYVTGDELMDWQKTILKALTSSERRRDIDYQVSRPATAHTAPSPPDSADHVPRLEALLTLLDSLLHPADVPPPAAVRQTPPPTFPPASEERALSTASDPPRD
jgi:hypothetical protein